MNESLPATGRWASQNGETSRPGDGDATGGGSAPGSAQACLDGRPPSPLRPAGDGAGRAGRWRSRLRLAVQAAIVVFWGVMMGLLVRDHFLPPDRQTPMDALNTARALRQWRDYEEWMQISFLALPVKGLSYVAVKRLEQTGEYAFTARYRFSITGSQQSSESVVNFDVAARLTPELSLNQFDMTIELPTRRMEIRGLIDGETLYWGIKGTEGTERLGSLPLKGQMAFVDGIQSMLPRQLKLEVGREYRFRAFDPVWNFAGGDVVIRVSDVEFLRLEDVEFEAYRLDVQFQNMRSTSWVTRDGEVLKRRVGNLLEMSRLEPAKARRLADFGRPLPLPDYKTDDFVLYMKPEDARRRGVQGGLFSLLGELMRAEQTP
ncbi:MAG: hypothetical protein Kow0059_11190 [Candidatus Sumerlaeia bacterium]